MTTIENGYRVVNEFHGFSKETRSAAQVKRLQRAAKPRDCKSRTIVYAVENGKIVGQCDWNGSELVRLS